MEVIPFGADALLIKFEQRIAMDISEQVGELTDYLHQQPYIRSLIPAYCSLTVVFDSKQCSFEQLKKRLEEFSFESSAKVKDRKTIQIPVCYGPEFGLDLEKLAGQLNISTADLIKLHTKESYHTYMIGFLPGFPYLGKTADQLSCRRLDQPRKKVAAGSVGLAGNQTGIYPIDAPGGWQIIGKTPLPIFKPYHGRDFLIEAGDTVKCYAISSTAFQDLENQIKSGNFNWKTIYE